MSVYDLSAGQSAEVIAVNVDGAAAERLYSLGIRKGAKVKCVAFSLFGVSVLVLCGYNRIGLRKAVAERIEVHIC